MKRLQIEKKITVWTTEFIEYDDTKYTEEEFVNQFHRVQNGYSNVKYDANGDYLYETYDYDTHQHSAEDINPHDDNGATLIILNEEGEELYDNLNKAYREAEKKE